MSAEGDEEDCLELHPADFPEFYFKVRYGWVTHNHQPFWVSDNSKYCLHCLLYIQRRYEASEAELKKLIQHLCSRIVYAVTETVKLADTGKRRVTCHSYPCRAEDEHGNTVRCALEYYLPRKTKKIQWLKYFRPMFDWMEIYTYYVEAECNPDCHRQTQEEADKTAPLERHYSSDTQPGFLALF